MKKNIIFDPWKDSFETSPILAGVFFILTTILQLFFISIPDMIISYFAMKFFDDGNWNLFIIIYLVLLVVYWMRIIISNFIDYLFFKFFQRKKKIDFVFDFLLKNKWPDPEEYLGADISEDSDNSEYYVMVSDPMTGYYIGISPQYPVSEEIRKEAQEVIKLLNHCKEFSKPSGYKRVLSIYSDAVFEYSKTFHKNKK